MARREAGCCTCSCLISTTTSAIFIWLAFRVLTPKCSIVEFDVFALQKPATNNSIHYDLKLKNRNFNKGIYYDALNLTFSYKSRDLKTVLIGDAIVTPFYQGYGKTAHKEGDFEPKTGVNLGNVTAGGGGVAEFRVEMKTAVRYRSPLRKTKRHSLVLGGDVKVNAQGSLVDGVVLRSSAGKRKGRFELMGILGILYLICSV